MGWACQVFGSGASGSGEERGDGGREPETALGCGPGGQVLVAADSSRSPTLPLLPPSRLFTVYSQDNI